MELKFLRTKWETTLISVLIVPLWNWNTCKGFSLSAVDYVLIVPLWNWNGARSALRQPSKLVLIVPLWNWNLETKMALWWGAVLIVPLWNWNKKINWYERSISRSNRTFMELKYFVGFQSDNVQWVLIVPLWNWNLSFHRCHQRNNKF